MKKIIVILITVLMTISLTACGSKVNTATINNIKFELPEGYSVEQASEVFGEEKEYMCKDANGQSLFAIAYDVEDWSEFGYTEFEQYFKQFYEGTDCELVAFANAKAIKYSAASQGIDGYDNIIYAFTNKDTTVAIYGVAYNEKDADVVSAFLNAVK